MPIINYKIYNFSAPHTISRRTIVHWEKQDPPECVTNFLKWSERCWISLIFVISTTMVLVNKDKKIKISPIISKSIFVFNCLSIAKDRQVFQNLSLSKSSLNNFSTILMPTPLLRSHGIFFLPIFRFPANLPIIMGCNRR